MKIAYAKDLIRTTETFAVKKPGDNCKNMMQTLENVNEWKRQQVSNRTFEEPDVAFFFLR